MKYAPIFALLVAMGSAAEAKPNVVEQTTKRFVVAIQKGLDPASAGLVPALTPDQRAQLKALMACKPTKSERSTRARVLLIWECGRGRSLSGHLTELQFKDGAVSTFVIERLVAAPTTER